MKNDAIARYYQREVERLNPRKAIAFILPTDFITSCIDHGTHNGYVAVPPTNRFYDMDYATMDDFVRVHGGLTFSCLGIALERSDWEIEFLDKSVTSIPPDWRIFGFDTLHHGDNKHNWNREAVIKETLSLSEQLTQ